jgi:hypothetical protein
LADSVACDPLRQRDPVFQEKPHPVTVPRLLSDHSRGESPSSSEHHSWVILIGAQGTLNIPEPNCALLLNLHCHLARFARKQLPARNYVPSTVPCAGSHLDLETLICQKFAHQVLKLSCAYVAEGNPLFHETKEQWVNRSL